MQLTIKSIKQCVQLALQEDIGAGDVTAQLIPEKATITAELITREAAVLCGVDFANMILNSVAPGQVKARWLFQDGDTLAAGDCIASFSGNARVLLTAERSMLNFIQCLSGIASKTAFYVALIQHTQAALLDTRKTIPGLRLAQKYAVACGGGKNHRMGLYDAFLLKENHIMACGGITAAVNKARALLPKKKLEIEVEHLAELEEAIAAKPDVIMLDNFQVADMNEAVRINNGQVKLEASGNVTKQTIIAIAETGVDYISMGDLTKNIQAIDLSMRVK